jgi:hypothetical protein
MGFVPQKMVLRGFDPCPGESIFWDFLGMSWGCHELPLSTHCAGGSSVSQGYLISEHAPNEELKKKNEEPNWAWIGLDFEDQADVHI